MTSPTLKRLLARLKQLRMQQGLTQEEFADKNGISYKYYQAVEAGRKRDPRLSTLERFAKIHGIEVWQLLVPLSDDKTIVKKDLLKAKRSSKK